MMLRLARPFVLALWFGIIGAGCASPSLFEYRYVESPDGHVALECSEKVTVSVRSPTGESETRSACLEPAATLDPRELEDAMAVEWADYEDPGVRFWALFLTPKASDREAFRRISDGVARHKLVVTFGTSPASYVLPEAWHSRRGLEGGVFLSRAELDSFCARAGLDPIIRAFDVDRFNHARALYLESRDPERP